MAPCCGHLARLMCPPCFTRFSSPSDMPVPPDDPRLSQCGFAKLCGDGGKLDYVIRSYEVLLGRASKGKSVDVQLAEHKAVSREHAYIRYYFDNSELGRRDRWAAKQSPRSLPAAAAVDNAARHHQRLPCSPPPSPSWPSALQPTYRAERFELEVLGKNGVKVNGVEHKPGGAGAAPTRVPLHSQSHLQIGDSLSFYFLLPKDPREVAKEGRRRK